MLARIKIVILANESDYKDGRSRMAIELDDCAERLAALAVDMALTPEGVLLVTLAERLASDGSRSVSPASDQLLRLADEVEIAPPANREEASLLADRLRYFAQLTTTLPMIDDADLAAAREAREMGGETDGD